MLQTHILMGPMGESFRTEIGSKEAACGKIRNETRDGSVGRQRLGICGAWGPTPALSTKLASTHRLDCAPRAATGPFPSSRKFPLSVTHGLRKTATKLPRGRYAQDSVS